MSALVASGQGYLFRGWPAPGGLASRLCLGTATHQRHTLHASTVRSCTTPIRALSGVRCPLHVKPLLRRTSACAHLHKRVGLSKREAPLQALHPSHVRILYDLCSEDAARLLGTATHCCAVHPIRSAPRVPAQLVRTGSGVHCFPPVNCCWAEHYSGGSTTLRDPRFTVTHRRQGPGEEAPAGSCCRAPGAHRAGGGVGAPGCVPYTPYGGCGLGLTCLYKLQPVQLCRVVWITICGLACTCPYRMNC